MRTSILPARSWKNQRSSRSKKYIMLAGQIGRIWLVVLPLGRHSGIIGHILFQYCSNTGGCSLCQHECSGRLCYSMSVDRRALRTSNGFDLGTAMYEKHALPDVRGYRRACLVGATDDCELHRACHTPRNPVALVQSAVIRRVDHSIERDLLELIQK